MTLHRGNREIQIRYMGRAHTDGDVVVFLPKERMIATGDMITSALSYTGDAFIEEWPATLEQVMTLDFDTVLPGHGNVFKGQDHIRNLQAYWGTCKTGKRHAEAGCRPRRPPSARPAKHAAAIRPRRPPVRCARRDLGIGSGRKSERTSVIHIPIWNDYLL